MSYGVTLVLMFPVGLVPMFMRDNRFALFHGKQAFMVWILTTALSVAGLPLMFFCGLGIIPILTAAVCHVLFHILGLVYSVQGRAQPLPLIGGWAEKWFRSVRVKPAA